MRILHIASSVARDSGGPSRSVQGLVAGLESVGVETWLMTMKPYDQPWVKGVTRYCSANRFYWFGMQKAVEDAIDRIKPDLVHIHSIWQISLHLALRAVRKKKIPYIIAPRGTVESWSLRQKWVKKKVALLTYQGYDFRHAIAFHATAESEAMQIRKLGYSQSVIISPNGVNVPDVLPPQNRRSDGFRRALFMSRIHYKKGLENLVEAWRILRPHGWKMEIVGTDSDNYQHKIETAVSNAGLKDDFIFTGPLADEEKWLAYRRSDCFVLPTFSENFGIVVAEALYAGLPVITTKGAPWQEIETRKCGYWIDVGVAPLVDALRKMFAAADSERIEMGARGRELVLERYSWGAIAERLRYEYENLLK